MLEWFGRCSTVGAPENCEAGQKSNKHTESVRNPYVNYLRQLFVNLCLSNRWLDAVEASAIQDGTRAYNERENGEQPVQNIRFRNVGD